MTSAIDLRSVSKNYGAVAALRNLSFSVQPGEIFGFLGLNGAGKTTTIRILLDLIRPTSGAAFIMGHNCRRQALRSRSLVGYLPGEMGFYGDMTGERFLDVLAGLGADAVDPNHREDLIRRLELPSKDLRRSLREYSTGMKRKLGLVQAMQGDPPILILDEPTEGLDPLVQESFYGILLDLHRRGRTIFMSSHVLSEVERICTRICIIRKGELALLSSVDELRRMAARRVRVIFDREVAGKPDTLPQGNEICALEPHSWSFKVQGPLGPLIQSLHDLPIRDIEVAEPKLEEILIRYYREDEP